MKKINLLSLVIVFVLFSFKQTNIYLKISKDNISIEYPSNWDAIDVPGYAFMVKEKAPSEKYSVLTNFAVEIDKNYSSLQEYTTFWKNKMSKSAYLSNWKLISEDKTEFKGINAKEFICTYEISSFKAKTKVIIIVVNNKIYNLNTTSSLESLKKKEITDRIYDSVIIKNGL